MAETNFLAGQASVWVQPGGPNTKPEFLGCHGIGDVEEPQGDVTLLYCPNPASAGKFMVKNSFQGAPGSPTFSIDTDIRKTADYLETVKCPVPIFVHKVTCGRRDDFTNFERTFIFRQSRITTRTLSNLAARTPDDEDESLQSFDFSAEEILRAFNLQANRVTISETEHINNIAVGGEDRCESDCGDTQDFGDIVVAVCDAPDYMTAANVLLTQNAGAPVATAADPFGIGEDIRGVVIFKVGKTTTRILVARGTTDGGNPAEVAYSDDYGVSWTNVNVGATNGEYVSNGHALFALDARNIWLGTNLGNVYFSEDGGIVWTKQTTAALSDNVAAISFIDDTYGFLLVDDGEVYKTIDGGTTWSSVTAIGTFGTGTDIEAIGRYFVYASATDGLYYSHDAGTTWALRASYNIGAIDYRNELEGLAVGGAPAGLIYQTFDGGYSWGATPTISNQGMLDVQWVNSQLAWICGRTQNGTGFLAKMIPVP